MPFRPLGVPFPRRATKLLLAGALAGFGTLAVPDDARADFRVCNNTESLVGVAIAYRVEEGWTSEGWWRIPATTCRSVIEGELTSRFYYLYAEDSEGVGRWAGEVNLCIAENEFRVLGPSDCFSRGYQSMGFREYDTGSQPSWMVQLTEAPRGAAETPAEPDAPSNDAPPPTEAAPENGEEPQQDSPQ